MKGAGSGPAGRSQTDKKTALKIQGGQCIKKERAGYSFMNLFIIVARGEMNLIK